MSKRNTAPKVKLKTRKVISKRVTVTKGGKANKADAKILTRSTGQDHFNSRDTGKRKRNKRQDKTISKTITRNIKRALGQA